jgi:hypothetical protein
MDNGLASPLPPVQESNEQATLCTYYDQVRGSVYNRPKIKEICKENVVDWLFLNGYQALSGRIDSCGTSFVHLEDSKGHEKYARIHCQNEICPSCGNKNSFLHLKRVRRAAARLLWNGLLGYFVFTIPAEISESRPDREIINKLTKKAWDIVKKNFDTPGGLSRIHMIGEKPGKLHIHINFLFPLLNEGNRGMISKDKIKHIRDLWTDTLKAIFKIDLRESNFKYSFADKPGKKIHKIKYVLRPIVTAEKFLTLSDEDRHYILSLRKRHNTRWYGDLSNSKYKKYLNDRGIDIDTIENEIDGLLSPLSGERYKYIGIVKESELPRHRLRWLDADTLVDFATFAHLSAESPGG